MGKALKNAKVPHWGMYLILGGTRHIWLPSERLRIKLGAMSAEVLYLRFHSSGSSLSYSGMFSTFHRFGCLGIRASGNVILGFDEYEEASA